MAEIRHLGNAPITEAVIDFRAKLPDKFDPKEFMNLEEGLKPRYPEVSEQGTSQLQFQISDTRDIALSSKYVGPTGYRFTSEDKKNILQFKTNGFTFSRLKPYTNWEQFSEEAFKLWHVYLEVAHPMVLVRIATRFINRIEIPAAIENFSDYLTYPPSLPPGAPTHVSSFLTRSVVHKRNRGFSAILILALDEKEATGQSVPVILDTDVFQDQRLDFQDIKSIKESFERFRKFKNEIFFNSITEKTAALFE